MEYQEYLDLWELLFGNAPVGEVQVWVRGKQQTRIVSKMTATEFTAAVATVERCGAAIDADQKKPLGEWDDAMQTRLFAESFPCEVQLLAY